MIHSGKHPYVGGGRGGGGVPMADLIFVVRWGGAKKITRGVIPSNLVILSISVNFIMSVKESQIFGRGAWVGGEGHPAPTAIAGSDIGVI